MQHELDLLCLLPKVSIQNANAMAGAITWGFPSVGAFLGFGHAISRKLGDKGVVHGVGVVAHATDPQIDVRKFDIRFNQLGSPLTKDGERAPIQESLRTHLEVSIVLAIESDLPDSEYDALCMEIGEIASSMKCAGGSIVSDFSHPAHAPEAYALEDDLETDARQYRRLKRRLMPGFALVDRRDYLDEHAQTLKTDEAFVSPMQAWLDFFKFHHRYEEVDGEVQWKTERLRSGWLIPIVTGYRGISDLYPPGGVSHTRDPSVPTQFVEATYSVGEWLSPHRTMRHEDILWFYNYQAEDNTYGFQQFSN